MVASGYKWGKGGTIAMFMGEYGHTIDAKGRIIVPAKFRESLGDNFIITKGLDNCLFVYTNESGRDSRRSLRLCLLLIRMPEHLQDSFLQEQQMSN